MDEWCAVWFWPTDEESLRHVPTPETFHAKSSEARSSIIRHLATDLKFFHWELEFPDVFTPDRSGFDALAGNPPWDVMKPNSQEFFSDFDPLYRTYDKQAAIRRQREFCESVLALSEQWDEYNARFKALGNWVRNVADPFDLALAKGKEGSGPGVGLGKAAAGRGGIRRPQAPVPASGQCRSELVQDVRRGILAATQARTVGSASSCPPGSTRTSARRTCVRNCSSAGQARLPLCLPEREEGICSRSSRVTSSRL